MTTPAASAPSAESTPLVPRILVFSTNNISDPGIDLAGSAHMHYSTGVVTITLPCTSGIKPAWILHAIQHGFDGVFVAADGEECAYLPDCSRRTTRLMSNSQSLLKANGLQPQRLKMAAICSVCAESFTKLVGQFSDALGALGPASTSAAPDRVADTARPKPSGSVPPPPLVPSGAH